MMTATYNRKPTFQMLNISNGGTRLDILAINHRGYWVTLGIDGTEIDVRPHTLVSTLSENTSA